MNGLVALVTGGGSGIGLATAAMLLDEGANVAIVGRDQQKLSEAVRQLGDRKGKAIMIAGDVSSEGHANRVVGAAVKALGSLHILVNCAGVYRGGEIWDMFEEDYDYVVDVNLKGTWFMCKFGSRAIRDAGGGSIVNVSSFLGLRGVSGMPSSAYSAAKGGVIALTRALAVELAPHRVRVNVVVPAVVRTPILSAVAGEEGAELILEKSKRWHPAGRAGEPEDVARAIVFLARPENNWITGAELCVDGGRAAV